MDRWKLVVVVVCVGGRDRGSVCGWPSADDADVIVRVFLLLLLIFLCGCDMQSKEEVRNSKAEAKRMAKKAEVLT